MILLIVVVTITKLFQFLLPLKDDSFFFSVYLDPSILGFHMRMGLDVLKMHFSACGAAMLDGKFLEMCESRLSVCTGALVAK